MKSFLNSGRKNYIYIIHGFRTRADWLTDLQNDLLGQVSQQVETGAYYYGGFSLPMFLLRTRFAAPHVAGIANALEALTQEGYAISIIAHSFGTFLLYEALKSNPRIQIRSVILCGGILERYTPLDRMKGVQISGDLYNFCGRKDVVPVLAELSSRMFSASGTEGLFNRIVTNSFHNVGHSGFLKRDFWRAHWIPLISTGNFTRGNAKLPLRTKLLLDVSTHRVPALVLLALISGAMLYTLDVLFNLRAPWTCRILSCYVESVLTVKDYNNSIRNKENYLYFNETLTAYNLNHDRKTIAYPYAPQPAAIDPKVIDILDKNKIVEKIEQGDEEYYPLLVQNRLAAFVAQYQYKDPNEVPGGVAYTAAMLTKDVNIQVRMPPGVEIAELFGSKKESLFLLEQVPQSRKWKVSRRPTQCSFSGKDRILCEDVWLKPNERLVYCFSIKNWWGDGKKEEPDLNECRQYKEQAAHLEGTT